MRIEAENLCRFDEIKCGTVFCVDDDFYLKTTPITTNKYSIVNAVDVESGETYCFPKELKIYPFPNASIKLGD